MRPNQEFLQSRAVKIKQSPASRQCNSQVDKLETKPASLNDWQSMVVISLVQGKASKKDIMEIFPKHIDL